MDLEKRMESYRQILENELQDIVSKDGQLYDWMRYHLGWVDQSGSPSSGSPGKQIRACAMLLTAEVCGASHEDLLRFAPLAASIELIHNFSLLHDDVEDESETRRGRPTLWTFAGLAQAINTGDGMFAIARTAQHRLVENGFSPGVVLESMKILDETCLRLVEGQQMDIDFEDRVDVTESEYIEMALGKTAAMFAAPLSCGALLAGAPKNVVSAFNQAGLALGLGFQMIDDVLGVWGDTEQTGKPVGDDLRTLKMTYPIIYGRDHDSKPGTEFAEQYVTPPRTEADVRVLTQLLTDTGAREFTEQRADEEINNARRILSAIPLETNYQQQLQEFSDLLVGRVS